MVQCCSTLSLNPEVLLKRSKSKDKCQNLTKASRFAAYLLCTVSNRIVALCSHPPLQLYTQILPLSRLVFCISLKGTFTEDVKRAESLSHFPGVVAPSRSEKGKPCSNWSSKLLNCCFHIMPTRFTGRTVLGVCGWMFSSLHPQLQLCHLSV